MQGGSGEIEQWKVIALQVANPSIAPITTKHCQECPPQKKEKN